MLLLVPLILLCQVFFIHSSHGSDINEWRTKSIYQLLTDRFNNPTSWEECNVFRNDYCGGTFKGIQDKLSYIANMGFDAIWISPVVENSPKGYHGYWASNFNQINSHFGSPQQLKDLVNAAHARNISVMVDVVANHMGTNDIAYFNPFNNPGNYHAPCEITNWNDQHQVENCRLCGLPDIDTESEYNRKVLYDWIKWLVREFKFDAIRIDTVKHVPKPFWPGFTSSAGVFSIGEVNDGNPAYVGAYQSTMDSLLNYPLYYGILDVFARRLEMSRLPAKIMEIRSNFKDTTILGNFIDNHDVARFKSFNQDDSIYKNAIAFTIFTEGIPVIYYGTEQSYSSAKSEENNEPTYRPALWSSKFDQNKDIYKFISKLNTIRGNAAPSFYTSKNEFLYSDSRLFVFKRGNMVIAVTNAGENARISQKIMLKTGNFNVIQNALKSELIRLDDDNSFILTINNGEPGVYFVS